MTDTETLAILGAGNIGTALALGLVASNRYAPGDLILTRRETHRLAHLEADDFRVTGDNRAAVGEADTVVLAVQPQQIRALLDEVAPALDPRRHLVISVVSDVRISDIRERIGADVTVARAMPNTAIEVGESMTCLAAPDGSDEALATARALFESVGTAVVIREEMMLGATALCACGTAFFLRAIRAASQGGIEIGFHPAEALRLAAQTARGAASLVLAEEGHPEGEIDRVTTPRGCTIAGLNEMEHQGFSSALIKGIVRSYEKADELYE